MNQDLDTTKSTTDMFSNSDPTGQGKNKPMKSPGASYPATSSYGPDEQIQSGGDDE